MSLYQLDIQKAVQGTYWTNKYTVEANGWADAISHGMEVVAIERSFHLTYVEFISFRVSVPGPEKPSEFMTTVIAGTGQRAFAGILPLTVALRVELFKGPRRPDLKYYRGCANSGDLANVREWTPAFISSILDGPCTALANVDGLVSSQGLDYLSVQPNVKVAQHQLRRGSRKKVTPIIPVS